MTLFLTNFLYDLFYTFKSTIKIIVFHPIRNRYKLRLDKEKTVYLLASGLSLRNDISNYLQELSEQNLFVMNQFVFSDLFLLLKPTCYVLTDPIYWSEHISETEREVALNVVSELKNCVSWDLSLFVPLFALKSERIKMIKENVHVKVIGYSSLSLNGFRFCRNYWYKKNCGMPSPQSVLNAAIFLALNSGYKVINLLGADHTWIKQLSVGYDGLIYNEDNHFYDKQKAKKVAIVDGDNKYWTIEKWLLYVAKLFRSHYVLKDYAKYLGVSIFNLTSDTMLDVYERRRIEDSF